MRGLLFFLMFFSVSSFAQIDMNLWHKAGHSPYGTANDAISYSQVQLYRLDISSIRSLLFERGKGVFEVTLPDPDGSQVTYELKYSPVMEPLLATKYGMIKTYAGHAKNNKSAYIRVSIASNEFNAFILDNEKTYSIEPTAEGLYKVFYMKDMIVNPEFAAQHQCGNDKITSNVPGDNLTRDNSLDKKPLNKKVKSRNLETTQYKEYKLAIATTSVYSSKYGNTKATVLAEVVNIINRVNAVYERELGIHYDLIDNTDTLFNLDSATDPFTNGDAGKQINQNPTFISSKIPNSSYDIGHVFGTATSGGVVGLAQLGSICTNSKARGVSNQPEWALTDKVYFSVSLVSHEMGHQNNATHTFNSCDDQGNENPETGYEPGSGVTIMSYAGACGSNNVTGQSIAYFHVNSLERILEFKTTGNGSICGNNTTTTNNTPTAELRMPSGFYAPFKTPFMLKGTGSDVDGDEVFYSWEQYDLGPKSAFGTPQLTAPAFRSYEPVKASIRFCPRLQTIAAKQTDKAEVIPTIAKEMNFRITARDNRQDGGGFDYKQVKFNITDQAGPFVVTSPGGSAKIDTFKFGQDALVTWDVARTNLAPVNSQLVDVIMSYDGGLNFTDTLLKSTPNSGSAYVQIPNRASVIGRIMVASADNYFFNINDKNFFVQAPKDPEFSLLVENEDKIINACVPGDLNIPINSFVYNGFNKDIKFTIVSGLPAGVTGQMTPAQIAAGASTALKLSLPANTPIGIYQIKIAAVAEGLDTIFKVFPVQVVSNDFSGIVLSAPANDTKGVSTFPSFSWTLSGTIDQLTFELATDPGFSAGSIVHTYTGVPITNLTLTDALDEGTVYFWRIKTSNSCLSNVATTVSAFQTYTFACNAYATNVPKNIPATGTPTVESIINVSSGSVISKIKVDNIKGNYGSLRDLLVTLVNPDAKEDTLWANKCGIVTSALDLGFDDESPLEFECLPNKGNVYKPKQLLSSLNGATSGGDWKLKVKVTTSGGGGGAINSWNLSLCGNVTTTPLLLHKNNGMKCKSNSSAYLAYGNLGAEDGVSSHSEIQFVLVTVPLSGYIEDKNGKKYEQGDYFTMSDLDEIGKLKYYNTDGNATEDDFFFYVRTQNSNNGFTGIFKFRIEISPDFVSTDNPGAPTSLKVYPVPANNLLMVDLDSEIKQVNSVKLISADGRIVYMTEKVSSGTIRIPVSSIVPGLYFVQVNSEKGTAMAKALIQR